jgi:hypothetical protein
MLALGMALFGAACQRGPAAARDLKLLGTALNDPARYLEAMNELARRPGAAQAAVREQSAPEGTRKAFLLRLIADHLERADDYRRWTQTKSESLDSSAQAYFWSERLLFGDSAQGEVAARHLSARCCEAAGEASIWRIRDTSRDPDAGFEIAAATVAKAAETDPLVAALEAWYGVDAAVRSNRRALDMLRGASNLLPASRHSDIEGKLLGALEKDSLSRAGRQARLALLWVVVDGASLERVAALRKSAWGTDLRRDIDPVLARAFLQSHRLGAVQ